MNSLEKAEENFQFDSGLSGANETSLRSENIYRSLGEKQSGVGVDQGEVGSSDNLLSDNFLNSGPNVPNILISPASNPEEEKKESRDYPLNRTTINQEENLIV